MKNILDEKIRTLIALGAAVASNCIPCFEHLYEEAVASGITLEEINSVVDIAGRVKNGAGNALIKSVEELTGNNINLPSIRKPCEPCCC